MADLREKIYRATVDYDKEHDLARPGEHDHIQSLTDRILALVAEDRRELVDACRAALADSIAGDERHGLSGETIALLRAAIAKGE